MKRNVIIALMFSVLLMMSGCATREVVVVEKHPGYHLICKKDHQHDYPKCWERDKD